MNILKHRAGLIQIHTAVLLAGGVGLFAKLIAAGPMDITCGITAFGGIALAAAAALTRSSLRVARWQEMLMLALSGVILALHWFTFFQSIQVSTVALGLLAFSTFPLFVTFLEPVIFKESLHRRNVISALVVVAGLVLVTPKFDIRNHLTQGVLWGIVSAFTFALLSLLSRSYVRKYPAITVAFYQQIFATLCTLPVAFQWKSAVTGWDILLLMVLGVIFTALAQGLVVASLRTLRAQTASIVFGLEPVYGILLAWILLHETPSLRTISGGALILGAVLWASFTHRAD